VRSSTELCISDFAYRCLLRDRGLAGDDVVHRNLRALFGARRLVPGSVTLECLATRRDWRQNLCTTVVLSGKRDKIKLSSRNIVDKREKTLRRLGR
jgi:hypothetical protein